MVLMKPQRKRAEGQGIRQIAVVGKLFFVAVSQTTCAGAGNKCPMKRLAFPDIDQDLLNDSLDSYVRAFGMKESFNLYNYKAMAPQHAEHARSMFKLHKLLKALLAASPSGQIKYRHLKGRCGSYSADFRGGSLVGPSHDEGFESLGGFKLPIA